MIVDPNNPVPQAMPMNLTVAQPLGGPQLIALMASKIYPAVAADQMYEGRYEGEDAAAVSVGIACRIAAYALVTARTHQVEQLAEKMWADINRDTRDDESGKS